MIDNLHKILYGKGINLYLESSGFFNYADDLGYLRLLESKKINCNVSYSHNLLHNVIVSSLDISKWTFYYTDGTSIRGIYDTRCCIPDLKIPKSLDIDYVINCMDFDDLRINALEPFRDIPKMRTWLYDMLVASKHLRYVLLCSLEYERFFFYFLKLLQYYYKGELLPLDLVTKVNNITFFNVWHGYDPILKLIKPSQLNHKFHTSVIKLLDQIKKDINGNQLFKIYI